MFLFGTLGLQELLILLLIVIIIFGARRLPELGKGLGEGIRSFRKSISGKDQEEKKPDSEKPSPPAKEE